MTTIPANQWFSSGNDFLKDAVAGTTGTQGLNFSGSETRYTGSLNGLATTTRADGRVLLYTGSSNAGIHLAIYDPYNDSWSETWTWVSRPGSGYTGTQSIGELAISDDGHFLAVGQGNPSSYQGVSMPSRGVQIGEIKADGTIQWLPISAGAQAKLNNENIRSLEWVGSTLIATSRNVEVVRQFDPIQSKYKLVGTPNGNTLSIKTDASGISEVTKTPLEKELRVLAKSSGYLIVASHDVQSESRNRVWISNKNGVATEELNGHEYSKLKQEEWFAIETNILARISVHPQLIDGKLIAFAGIYKADEPLNTFSSAGKISEIIRLVIDPVTKNLESYQHYHVAPGDIGTNQANNSFYYGFFSFAVDPHDPNALGVYTGGNLFLEANEPALIDGGGLVKITFPSSDTKGVAQAQISEYLYGPRVSTDANGKTTTTFNPGQPHADSRSIDFYISKYGPRLIQSDDGGVWEINLNTNNLSTDSYWQPLVGPGLTGLETVMTSWISNNNSILSSYQDNGASLGYLNDSYATNFWNSDGKLVFVDDGSEAGEFSGYLTSQKYLSSATDSKITRLNFSEEGYVESSDIIDLYYQRSSTSAIIPWEWTEDAQASVLDMYPLEVNAYQKGDIVLASASNIYAVTQAHDGHILPANGLLLRPLLRKNGNRFVVSSLDNQQSSLHAATFTVGTDGTINHIIYSDRPNNESEPTLTPVIDFEKVSPELNSLGAILDIVHQPTKDGNALYWIQGGLTPRYRIELPIATTQYLMVWNPDTQEISKVTLTELGLPTIEAATGQTDQYGYQAVCFVPGRGIRNDQLVIGGPLGIFTAELPANGVISAAELTFEEMPFDGMESDQNIGSYVQSIDYDPNDDLLIAGTIGQGSYLYSFSGELGQRIYSNELQIHNITLPMRSVADLDKRGNEQNSNLVIQIDKEPSKQTDTTLKIVLHDADKWREYMEVVSPFHFNLPDHDDNDDTLEALRSINLLEEEGRKNFGAEVINNDIHLMVDIPAATSFYALEINQKSFRQNQISAEGDNNPKLRFSVTDLGYPNATKEAAITLESQSKSGQAVAYSPSSLNLELAYLAAIPLDKGSKEIYDNELQKHAKEIISSNTFYNYSFAKDAKSDGLGVNDFRLTVPIDTFTILRTSEELDSKANSTKWLQALITSDSVDTGTNKKAGEKFTYTDTEIQEVGSGAKAQVYDPITQKGARFYDINNDGYADHLSISAGASQTQFTTNISVGFGSVELDPIFTSSEQHQIHLHDPINPETAANIRLTADLVKQAVSTSSLGYILLDPSEDLNDFTTELFKDRARNLITSLGDWVDLSAIPEGFRFSSEFLANTGQRLLVFEVEGASLDQLSGLDDPRLSWLNTKLTADGKTLSVSSLNGAEASIAITPGVQDLNPLIADQQSQTPILDFTALASDQSINFTLNYGREAALDSVTGWYIIQSRDGAIAATDGQTLRPGDLNYISEALRSGNRIDAISGLSIANRQTQSVGGEILGGTFLAPYAKVNNDETYVAFPEANSDRLQHFMMLGENLIGFEDLPNGGDRDFQDFVWKFNFSIGQI